MPDNGNDSLDPQGREYKSDRLRYDTSNLAAIKSIPEIFFFPLLLLVCA